MLLQLSVDEIALVGLLWAGWKRIKLEGDFGGEMLAYRSYWWLDPRYDADFQYRPYLNLSLFTVSLPNLCHTLGMQILSILLPNVWMNVHTYIHTSTYWLSVVDNVHSVDECWLLAWIALVGWTDGVDLWKYRRSRRPRWSDTAFRLLGQETTGLGYQPPHAFWRGSKSLILLDAWLSNTKGKWDAFNMQPTLLYAQKDVSYFFIFLFWQSAVDFAVPLVTDVKCAKLLVEVSSTVVIWIS